MMKDLHNNIKASLAMPPKAAVTDNTAFVSEIIDTANFGSCEFIGIHGTNADANTTYTILVEDGNDSALGDNAAVDDVYLLGTEAGAAIDFADDNKVFKIGYVGPKRYVRVTVTPADNTGNAFIAGVWVLGHPRNLPQDDQVV